MAAGKQQGSPKEEVAGPAERRRRQRGRSAEKAVGVTKGRRPHGRAAGGARLRGDDTATQILDSAERLVQARGFNGFSYADVAAELGVTKASLHYHFTSKTELGQALLGRYTERFAAALEDITGRLPDAPARLQSYADLYADVLSNERLCLCGMLAADYATLPDPLRTGVIAFFDANEAWLETVLDQGRTDGSLRFALAPRQGARLLIGALEGAMLVARPYGDVTRFISAATDLLATFTVDQPAQVSRGASP